MNSMEQGILEGNERIVKFMGGVYEKNPFLGDGYRFSEEDKEDYRWGSQVSFLHKKSLSYHHNWNYLMAVLRKIKETIGEPQENGQLKDAYLNIFDGVTTCFSCQLTFLEVDYFLKMIEEQELKTERRNDVK